MSFETIGYAPNDSRCYCEQERCTFHKDKPCSTEAMFLIEWDGEKTRYCGPCYRVAKNTARQEALYRAGGLP